MTKKTLIILLFTLLPFFQIYPKVILISLGGDCAVATMLRRMNLRQVAYPFDWMYSELPAVYAAIQDDFKRHLEIETLKINDADKTIVIDAYGLKYVHDFPTINEGPTLDDIYNHPQQPIRDDWREYILPIREKYQRRIERLRTVFKGFDEVFLIRYPVRKDDKDLIIALRDLLTQYYPNLKFTIVAVSGQTPEIVQWNLEKIKNFYAEYESPHFQTNWKKIFNELGIDLSQIELIPA
jgi:hypothetical protein